MLVVLINISCYYIERQIEVVGWVPDTVTFEFANSTIVVVVAVVRTTDIDSAVGYSRVT